MKRKILLLAFAILAITTSAKADWRHFVWTYQYMTMPKGMTEFEFYQTTKLGDLDIWEYRIEVEHGITRRWDFSVYQIFKQSEDGILTWDAVQFRTRYRFGELGKSFLDPLLYLEYNRKLDSSKPNKLELKLILAKTTEKVNFAINPVYEFFFSPGIEHEVGLDVGVSIPLSPQLRMGLESTSRMEFENGDTEVGSYLGPTLSFASGKWWYTMGVAVGITDHTDDARIRFIMGVLL
jgi:hypothetical protein